MHIFFCFDSCSLSESHKTIKLSFIYLSPMTAPMGKCQNEYSCEAGGAYVYVKVSAKGIAETLSTHVLLVCKI